MQNSTNCDSARKLVCAVNQYCGYVCQLHFYIVCHLQGYYLNRTVIFKDLDPKVDKGIGSHIVLVSDINRFKDTYDFLESCSYNPNDVLDVEGNK